MRLITLSTVAQFNANHQNSQESTGPSTPEGKAASSLNTPKSGIHAVSAIIRGEDRAELEALTAAFLLTKKLNHLPIGFVPLFASSPGERPP